MINSSNSDSASTTLTADSVITNGGIRIYELSKGASGADSINPYRIRMNVSLKESGGGVARTIHSFDINEYEPHHYDDIMNGVYYQTKSLPNYVLKAGQVVTITVTVSQAGSHNVNRKVNATIILSPIKR